MIKSLSQKKGNHSTNHSLLGTLPTLLGWFGLVFSYHCKAGYLSVKEWIGVQQG